MGRLARLGLRLHDREPSDADALQDGAQGLQPLLPGLCVRGPNGTAADSGDAGLLQLDPTAFNCGPVRVLKKYPFPRTFPPWLGDGSSSRHAAHMGELLSPPYRGSGRESAFHTPVFAQE